MNEELTKLKDEILELLRELEEQDFFYPGQNLVIGCSTSEVQGEDIGKSSSLDVAEVIFEELKEVSYSHEVNLIFQGCEHINRALTMEGYVAEKLGLPAVAVIPQSSAGGSLSEFAYGHMHEPVVVENVIADAGIDIGQTLIGMHLKEVAVPVRTSARTVGSANVTIARTRPKLIGGPRAKYEQ